jgi:hypothetical protein
MAMLPKAAGRGKQRRQAVPATVHSTVAGSYSGWAPS